jgi:hypothetical protein
MFDEGRTTMRKTLTILLGAALFAAAFVAGGSLAPAEQADASTTTARTTTGTTTTDRAEVNEDRGGRAARRARVRREAGEDVRGPCDEAEHRNDPRCTGAAAGTRRGHDDDNDNHRRGRGRSGGDDGGRSGSNSGRG